MKRFRTTRRFRRRAPRRATLPAHALRLGRLVAVWLAVGAQPVCLAQDGNTADGEERRRVDGVAYSRTSVPPVIDDPSDEFLEEADARDGSEDVAYSGLDDYDLRDGPGGANKREWALTDYIHWRAQGATLEAHGQVHDSHAAKTSEVSSSAWGAQMVEVEIAASEGDTGVITAENRVFFTYGYTVSGASIRDAKVLLKGTCVDIRGKKHNFSLSDTRSESVTERIGITRMHVVKRKSSATVNGGAQAKNGSKGPSGSASFGAEFEAEEEVEEGATVDVSIERALPGSGGDTGTESAPLVSDEVKGETPLKKSYAVYSTGSVTLAARGAADSPTVVRLQQFRIENSLKVWKKAEHHREPDDAEPGDGGAAGVDDDQASDGASSSGGTDGAAGEADTGEGTAEGTGSTGAAGAADSDSIGGRRSSEPIALDGVTGLDGITARLVAIPPFGLQGEPGSVTGELHVILSEPAPRDLTLSIACDPPDALELLPADALTIRAGERFAGGLVRALDAGAFVVSLHLLTEDGLLSGREAAVAFACSSTSVSTEPRLYACAEQESWSAGRGTTIHALVGHEAPALRIGRLGFDRYATSATTVAISVDDPSGVLSPLPDEITIAAGEAEVRLELPLRDVSGIARLTLSAGKEAIEVAIVRRVQEWSALPVIRIPVGAVAAVPFELRWPERAERAIQVSSEDAAVASPVAGSEALRIVPGGVLQAATVHGLEPGEAVIRFVSDGLPDLLARVQVVPARVSAVAGMLRLTNLPIGTSGLISLALPDGVVISELSVPPEWSEQFEVTGVGSGSVLVRIEASPELPGAVDFALRLEGGGGGAVPVDVAERLDEDAPAPVRNSYRILVDR